MVLAARLCGIPAALTEADAHLGLANRLAAPFAAKLFLAYADSGAHGREGGGRRSPDPGRPPRRESVPTRGRRFGLGSDVPTVAVFGALAGATSLNEMAVSRLGR